jgi:hypothetical protein
MRRDVPVIILAFVALTMIVETFFDIPVAKALSADIKNWGIIISGFALAVGVANLVRFHAVRVSRRTKDWYNSASCLVVMVVFAIVGVFMGPKTPVYAFYYNNFIGPCQTALQGMTVFYVGSACYRAFTVRNLEAGLLLVTAVIIMLASVPVGLLISKWIPEANKWIMDIPNMSGQRGIIITSAIGSMAIGLRVVLGIERSHFGGE